MQSGLEDGVLILICLFGFYFPLSVFLHMIRDAVTEAVAVLTTLVVPLKQLAYLLVIEGF